MPTISFSKKNRPSLVVESGANLMQALVAAQIPVASSCKGDGICRKCRVHIKQGQKNLSPEGSLEQRWRDTDNPDRETRLSCQSLVLGDIDIDTPYW